MRISRKLAAVAAFFVIAAAIAGCGSSIPGNSVATVAGNPITLQAFNHWLYVAAKEQSAQAAAQGSTIPVIVPDPPTFKNCIAEIRAGIPQLAHTPVATLRTDCKSQFTGDTTTVMNFLIQGYWFQAEAHKLGIKAPNLTKDFNKAINKQFATKGSLAKYLQSSGQTKQDLLFQFTVQTLYAKLIKHFEKKSSPAAINAYYNAHKTQFGTQESRDLHLVRVKTAADAQAAYNALKTGQSWATVAKKYAADANAKANAGMLIGVTAGQEESAVSKAIFANPVGKLVAPVHGIFGYYVVQVTKITPGTQQSLAKATPTIKALLTQQQQSAAQTKAAAMAKQSWFKKTTCRSNYQVTFCSNYVKPPTPTTAAPPTSSTPSTVTTSTSTGTATATTATTATTTTK